MNFKILLKYKIDKRNKNMSHNKVQFIKVCGSAYETLSIGYNNGAFIYFLESQNEEKKE